MPFDGTDASQAVQALLWVREKLATPDKWCCGNGGSRNGAHCLVWAFTGCPYDAQWLAFRALERQAAPQGIIEFNDTHTHAEVLDLIDRAIANAAA